MTQYKVHRVACSQIIELQKDLYEILVDEGAEITLEDCHLSDEFWLAQCDFPFDILIDANRQFSYSFDAALSIGSHPQQRCVAIYSASAAAIEAQQSAVEINQLTYASKPVRTFKSRDEALAWLLEQRLRLNSEVRQEA